MPEELEDVERSYGPNSAQARAYAATHPVRAHERQGTRGVRRHMRKLKSLADYPVLRYPSGAAYYLSDKEVRALERVLLDMRHKELDLDREDAWEALWKRLDENPRLS